MKKWKLPSMKNREKINGGRGWGNEQSLKDLWGYNRLSNISIRGVPKGEKEKSGAKKYQKK